MDFYKMEQLARSLSLVIGLLVGVPAVAPVASAQPRGDRIQRPSESFLPLYLRQRMAERVSSRRDSREITSLLRPLARVAGQSTVEVISDGKRVGLGTIVTADGYVVTKASEIKPNSPLRVRLPDDRMMTATMIDQKRSVDLALIKMEATNLTPIRWHNNEPPVGSFLISVGRLGDPVGIGVASVKSREVQDHGLLGVMLRTDSVGAGVLQVVPGSGADQAGIRKGDVITAVDGVPMQTHQEVTRKLRALYPGDTVDLTVVRDDADNPLQVTAEIRELSSFSESSDDTRVNGPRNSRLTGFAMALQHDTVLGPDQCGGPVVDSNGNVVGINIARAGRVCSYAIPTGAIQPIVDQMLREAT